MKFVCGPRHGQDVPPGLSNSLQDVIDVTDVRWQNMPADDPVLTCQYTRRWFCINDRHVQFFGDVSSTEQDIHAAAAKMFNPVLDPVVAPVARLLWPLGINPDMDQHAAQQGLSHWSCTTSTSQHWIRRDGRVHVVTFITNGGYPQELRDLDSNYPVREFVFGAAS